MAVHMMSVIRLKAGINSRKKDTMTISIPPVNTQPQPPRGRIVIAFDIMKEPCSSSQKANIIGSISIVRTRCATRYTPNANDIIPYAKYQPHDEL